MFYFKRNSKSEKTKWHIWFAWYPVTVSYTPDGDSKKVWLEYVLRCGELIQYSEGSYYIYKYREL